MAIISSHILDSVSGDHAAGIRIECRKLTADGTMEPVFDVNANLEGRISQELEVAAGEELQLHIYAKDYFASHQHQSGSVQIMPVIVVQLQLPEPLAKYHVPIMLSPHAYSVWWSGKPVKQEPR